MEKKYSLLLRKQWFISPKQGRIQDYYLIDTEKPLGNGAFGIVYKAKLKGENQNDWRAIKKIPKKKIKKGVEKDLISQIQILQRLDHPHIVKLYQTFEDSSNIYLVTEFCQGGELFDKILEQQYFTEIQARNIFRQIMLALNYCHSQNVAHRDLKLQNFLYLNKSANSPLKLIDFGLSFRFLDQINNKQGKKMVTRVGTNYYIAPEVLTGKYNQSCDIWSAGVILYMIVTGVPPFDGQSDQQILKNVMSMKYSLDIEQFNYLSEQLKNLIKKMLVTAQKRPTAEQILRDPWFMSEIKIPKPLNLNINTMKQFANYSKIKKIVVTLIATQIQQKDIIQLGNIFKSVDRNNDGLLSFQEIKSALQQQKQQIIQSLDLKKILESIDTDHNGYIAYTQFIASCLQQSFIIKQQNIRKAFRIIDINADGKISKDELRILLQREDFHVKNELLDSMMKQCDLNGDGFIDYQQFLGMMSNLNIK